MLDRTAVEMLEDLRARLIQYRTEQLYYQLHTMQENEKNGHTQSPLALAAEVLRIGEQLAAIDEAIEEEEELARQARAPATEDGKPPRSTARRPRRGGSGAWMGS